MVKVKLNHNFSKAHFLDFITVFYIGIVNTSINLYKFSSYIYYYF